MCPCSLSVTTTCARERNLHTHAHTQREREGELHMCVRVCESGWAEETDTDLKPLMVLGSARFSTKDDQSVHLADVFM